MQPARAGHLAMIEEPAPPGNRPPSCARPATARHLARARHSRYGRSAMPVIGFDLHLRRPLAGGQRFGDVGAYEELKGQLRLAIDPAHPANARITDVALAPRNAAGRVEFAADVSILLPVDRARASGRLLVDVVNRGNIVAVPNF